MIPRRFSRTVLPAAAAVMCGLLASCSGSGTATTSGAAPSPNPTGQATTAPPSGAPSGAPSGGPSGGPSSVPTPAASPSMKTLPPSKLCGVLDTAAAGQVLTGPKPVPRAAVNKGTALDSCSYTTGDRTSLLTLNPSARTYATERSASQSLVSDPASAGMRDVKVAEVTGLGQAAFSESAEVLQPKQSVAFVVWNSGSHVWVLTLAQPDGAKDGAGRLVALAKRITPRLAG
ncbi:hypothetical protein [Streptomyces graminilatus]|uniref:hypothetical protein n=1 Tax=Streptomyces graminilatus TaxID=1464070 RepID=UPI0006E317ED|nr:hypothetical protein [Streptomyces graminilatus]